MLKHGRVATRLPVHDLERARSSTRRSWASTRKERPGGLLYYAFEGSERAYATPLQTHGSS